MLYYVFEEKITQPEQLNKLHKLFLELLNTLVKVNSIK